MNDDKIKEILSSDLNSADIIEEVITQLKEAGVGQAETVKLLADKLKLSIKEVDKIILKSEAWKDRKEANLKIRNDFFDFLENYDDDEE